MPYETTEKKPHLYAHTHIKKKKAVTIKLTDRSQHSRLAFWGNEAEQTLPGD